MKGLDVAAGENSPEACFWEHLGESHMRFTVVRIC